MSHGILSYILPFAFIAIARTQLGVPKVSLPAERWACNAVCDGHEPLPKRNPSLQGGILSISWSAEKMNVIWQDDEPTDKP